MQESFLSSPTWTHTILGWIASFLSGVTILKLVTVWLNRRKPAAEIHLTEANATEVTIRANSNAGEAVIRMMDRLDAAQITIDQIRAEGNRKEEELRTQIRFWRNKAEELDGELVDSRQANGLLQARYKNKKDSLDKAMALLHFHKIKYSELDEPKDS